MSKRRERKQRARASKREGCTKKSGILFESMFPTAGTQIIVSFTQINFKLYFLKKKRLNNSETIKVNYMANKRL